jgi:hypothetical protein
MELKLMATLKQQLLAANLELTEKDFSAHASDLYVKNKAGVKDWLLANYILPENITHFTGAEGSDWEGINALEIPFTFDIEIDKIID